MRQVHSNPCTEEAEKILRQNNVIQNIICSGKVNIDRTRDGRGVREKGGIIDSISSIKPLEPHQISTWEDGEEITKTNIPLPFP